MARTENESKTTSSGVAASGESSLSTPGNSIGRETRCYDSLSLLCRGSCQTLPCVPELAELNTQSLAMSWSAYHQARREFNISDEGKTNGLQQGSVIREHRKLGPDVWCFRWWEARPNGNRVHRRIVLGTAEQMRDAASARQLTFGLVREINTTDIRPAGISMTLAQLADHFHQRELGRPN